ncbi:MAG: ABC transporter ATP-binding protein [Thermoplasmata archaeon]|nr:ABC transporter ATP-binding protein [Thermoplasmata archaeon]
MSGASLSEDGALPLEVAGLAVAYGERTAVRQLSFHVASGEIYGLLGSNGAGKTSTIRSVVGLVKPSSGSIRIFGIDPHVDGLRAKEKVGYVPESPLLFDALTPREFLEFVSSVRRLASEEATARTLTYARAFQVERELDTPMATLSHGTRQKMLLTAAFLHQPPLLVLDEPLNNLDPRSVSIMRELLGRYVKTGRRGVLFSTHTMEVAERLCHRVGILDQGELKGEGTLGGLRAQVDQGDASLEQIFLRLTSEEEAVREAVRSLGTG